MILCTENDKKEVFDYIGDQYGKCLYLYIDLLKYGFECEQIKLWCQRINGSISVLVFKYYSGVHVFSKEEAFDVEEVIQLLNEIKPSMICGMATVLKKIAGYLDLYEMETGSVAMLKHFRDYDNGLPYQAKENELKELVQMLQLMKHWGNHMDLICYMKR